MARPVADVVIRNAQIVDGTGSAGRSGSVVVAEGVVTQVRDDRQPAVVAALEIDAGGMTVTPGFIDTHIHSDVDLLWNRQHAATLLQGVTTHVIGQDGFSYAPLSAANLPAFARYIAPVDGQPRAPVDGSSVAAFLRCFDRSVAANTAYAVPQGTLRFEVAGMAGGPLSPDQLRRACELLDDGLSDGGVALSTGLSYFPGSFAGADELISLGRVAARHGVPYVTHVRSAFTHGPVDPLGEAIEIARRSGAALHVSHWRTTAATLGQVDRILEQLDAAYGAGLDISLDTYPYVHGSGPVSICLPSWAFEGGIEQTIARLADPTQRAALLAGMAANPAKVAGVLTHVANHPEYEDRDLRDVAAERGQSVPDTICDVLADAWLDVTFHQGTRELLGEPGIVDQMDRDCLAILERPYAMVGSDGIYVGRRPHERAFGTFAKLLRLSREQSFPLERMINRMTKNAADRFGLTGRGVLAPGSAADLVVFDPREVRERCTPTRPRRAPVGVAYVFVNGELAVDGGNVTGIFAGRALGTRRDGPVTR